jgi:hypothetical protein
MVICSAGARLQQPARLYPSGRIGMVRVELDGVALPGNQARIPLEAAGMTHRLRDRSRMIELARRTPNTTPAATTAQSAPLLRRKRWLVR